MQVLIRFSKLPCARFVSHLDQMRMMQRAFRRACWPLAYSNGYHPHPQMSFALALPVGACSHSELMQVEVMGEPDLALLMKSLVPQMPDGFRILELRDMGANPASLMAQVEACDWTIDCPGGDPEEAAHFCAWALAQDQIPAVKQGGKSKGKDTDLRPGLLGLSAEATEFGCRIHARLAAGSQTYVQPALCMSVAPQGLRETAWSVCREEMYTRSGEAWLPLADLYKGV